MQRLFFRFISVLVLLTFYKQTSAQLSGSFNVPISYTSIAAAINDLNLQGVSGPVFINISAGYTETAPVGGYLLTASGTSLNPITFRKVGIGANPLINAYGGGTGTPATAVQDGVWRLVGSDFITIDGIDINDPNLTNPSSMEYGYGFFKLNTGNGCQYNTIQNCVITLKRVNNAAGAGPAADGSRAINVVNSLPTSQTTVLTPTSSLGTNSNNKFYNNTLQNCNIGIALIGFAATSPFTLADTDNEIGSSAPSTGNTIINFGGATAATNPAAAIRTLAQYNVAVINNVINNNTGTGVNHVSALRGVYLNTATSANASVSGNSITLNSAANAAVVAAIENVSGATAANNTISISNNLISNCTNSANTSGSFYGVYNNGASSNYLIVTNNIFSGLNTRATTGSNYLIYNTGAVTGVMTLTNNLITNCTNSASTSGNFFGIYSNVASTAWLNMSSNTFTNTSAFASTGSIYGIYNSGAISNSITLKSNTITASSFSINSTGNYFGIYNGGIGNAELNLSLNSIQGTSVSLASGSAFHLYNTAANSTAVLLNDNSILNSRIIFSSTGSYYALYNNAASSSDIQMNNNVYTGNIHSATSGSIHVLYNRGTLTNTFVTSTFTNNLISNCQFSASAGGPFLGIYNSGVNCNALAISNNTLAFNNWISSTSARYYLFNSAQVNTLFDFNNNLVTDCNNTVNTTGTLNGLLNTGACATAFNMCNNTFTNSTNQASTGGTFLFYNSGVANLSALTLTNNSVGSFTNNSSGSGTFNGIYNTGTNYASLTITNNTFTNSVFNASTGLVALINNNGVATTSITSIQLNNNTIANCSSSVSSNAAFYGIYNATASSQSLSLSNNSISNFSLTTVNGANYLVYNSGALTSTYNVMAMNNNLISNSTFSASAAAAFYGIWNNGVRTQNSSLSSNTFLNNNWITSTALIYGIANFGAATVSTNLNNNLFSANVFTSNTTGSFYGVYTNNSSTVSGGPLTAISNTFINLSRSATTGETHFINVSGVTTNTFSSIDVSNNLITSCSSSISGAGPYYGIYNNTASTTSLSINSNTFSTVFTGASTGPTHLIYNRGIAGSVFANVAINLNSVSSFTSTINSTGPFYGIFNSGAATSTSGILSLSGNTFTNSSIAATSSAVYLIYSTCPTSISVNVNSNNISNFSNSLTTTGLFYGINTSGNVSNGDLSISNNLFSNLNSSASTGNRYLLYNGGGVSNTLSIQNNLISNCNHSVSGNGSYYAINNNSAFSGSLVSLSNNTLSINSTSLSNGSNYLILNSGALTTTLATITITNNTINNYTHVAISAPFFAVSNTGVTAVNGSISSNSLTNLTILSPGSTQQLVSNSARVTNSLALTNNLISSYSSTLTTTGSFFGINNTLAYAGGNYPANLNIANNRLLSSAISSSNGALYFINTTGVTTNTILNCDISMNELSGHTHNITAGGNFFGINQSAISNSVLSITGNTLSGIVSNSSGSPRNLIYNGGAILSSGTMSSNLITNFTGTNNTVGSYFGIVNAGNVSGNLSISNNQILNHTLTATTGSLFALSNSGIISNSISLNNNVLSNVNHSASASGGFTGIYNNAGSSNQLLIGSNTFTSINLSTTNGGSYFIFNRAAVAGTISNIAISNNLLSACSFSAASGPFYGVLNSGNSYGSLSVASNSFLSIQPNTTSSNWFFINNTGLGLVSGTLSIQNNLISAFNSSLNTIGNFYGIFNQGNTLGHLSVLSNTLTNLNLRATNGLSYMIYNTALVNTNDLSNNLISNVTNSCSGSGTYYGIFNQASTSSVLNMNFNTMQNISLSAPTAATYLFFNNGISTNTIASASLSNNSLSNFTLQSTSGNLFGFYNNGLTSGSLSINNNVLSNIVLTTTNSTRYFLYNSGVVTSSLSIQSNLISNLSNSLNTTGTFFGINNGGNCLGSASISNNNFTNHLLSSTTGSVLIFYNTGLITNSLTVANNSVSNFSNTSNAGSFFYGIYNNAGSSAFLGISANTFTNILHTNSTGALHFIYNRGAITNTINALSISNNLLSDLTFTASSGPFYGIFNNATSFGSLTVNGNTFSTISSTTSTAPRFFIYNTGAGNGAFTASNNAISGFSGLFNTTGSYNGISNTGNISGNLNFSTNSFINQNLAATTSSAFVLFNSGIISNSITISNNSVSGFTHSASGSGGFNGVFNNAGSSSDLNISSNSFATISIGSTSGAANIIFNRAAVAGTITNMTVSNNSLSAFDFTTSTGPFFGINNNGMAFANLSVSGNSFVSISTSATNSARHFILNNGTGSTSINVTGNQLTNFTSTLNTTGLFYGILNTGACNGSLNLSSNSLSNLNLTASTASVYGIQNTAAISNSINISSNTLSGINYTSATGAYYGLANTSAACAQLSLSNNTLSANVITNSVSPKYLIYNTATSASSIQLSGNSIAGYSNTPNSNGINYVIFNTGSSAGNIDLNNNTISNLAVESTSVPVYMVYNSGANSLASGTIQLNNNSISGLAYTSNSGLFYGVVNNGTSSGGLSMDNNTFSNSILTTTTSNRFLVYNTALTGGNISFTNNILSGITSSVNTSGGFYGIYNIGTCLGSLAMNNNSLSTNFLETNSGITYMIANTASVTNGINMNVNSISGYSNSLATSADFYGVLNTGSLSPFLSMSSNTFSNNFSNVTTGLVQLIANSGLISNSISIIGNNLSQGFSNASTDYSGVLNAIYNTGGALSTSLNISNNNFHDFQFAGTAGTGNLYFIHNTNNNSQLEVLGNTWTNLSLNHNGNEHLIYNPSSTQNSLSVSNNSVLGAYTRAGLAGGLFIYYSNGNSPATCNQVFSGNNFSNFTANTQGTGSFYGFYSSDGVTSPFPKKTVNNNVISNINYNGLGFMYGLYFDFLGDANTGTCSAIYNNTVTNINWAGPFYGVYSGSNVSPTQGLKIYSNLIQNVSTSGQNADLYGAYLNANGANFFKNKISDLNAGGNSATASGIKTAGSGNVELSNNLIGNIYTPSTSVTNALNGIYLAGGSSANLYFNTVLLNAMGTGSNFASNALYALSTISVNLQNNIFINTSTASGTGITAAYRRSSNALSNYSLSSNNNVFYAGIPAFNRVLFHDGTTSALTLPAFQTLVSPRESISVSENSPMTSTLGANSNFLHINNTIPSLTDNGAANTGGIADDVDLQIRQGNTGYVGVGTAPDIGADEYDANLTPCLGANAGTAIIPSSTVRCSGETIYMLSSGYTAAGGIVHQWKVSNTPGGPYTNVVGGSGANYVAYTTPSLNAGVYYYVLVTTCTIGSLSGTSNEVTVTVNQTPTVNVSISNQPLCSGQELQLIATGSNGTNYTWLGPNNFTSSIQNPTISNVSSNASGTYTLLVSDVNCTSSPVFVSATVNPSPPVFSLSPASASLCAGSSQTIGASVPVTNPTLNFGSQTYQNSASGYPAPYSVYYGGQKMQVLVLASELATSGFTVGSPISSIQFTVNSLGANWGNTIQECQNFKVSIKSTTTSILSVFETGLSSVVGPINYTPVVGGNNIHVFSAPFIWDGLSNVVIETVFSNSIIGTSGNTVIQNNSPTGFQSTLVYRADNQNISTVSAATTSNVNVGFVRPDFSLNGAQVGTYSWSPSTGLSSTSATSVIASPTITTVYNASLSNGQCATTASMLINVILTPTVTIATTSTLVCLGNNATLTAGGASTYTWSNNSTNTTIVVSPFINTTYTVTGSNPACPNASTSILLNSAPALTLSTVMVPPTLCQGQTATISVSGASNYTWTGGSNSTSIIVTPSLTTNYIVNASSGPGCWASKTVLAKVNPIPFISITPASATICPGQTITIEASGVFSFTWLPGNSNSPIIEISPSVTTVYSVTGVDLNTCVNTASMTVTVDPCVSIAEQTSRLNEIELYPNPSEGLFTLSLNVSGEKFIQVITSTGQVVFEKKSRSDLEEINLTHLSKGVYFFKVTCDQGEFSKKMIIQ